MSSIQEHVEKYHKNTQTFPIIAVGWLVVVEQGHTGYQIETSGIYESKARLDLSKIPCGKPLLATLVTLK